MTMTLLTTNTTSGGSSSAFTSKIDSTYKLYVFSFININVADNAVEFQFNVSTDGGSNYNLSKQSTCFQIYQPENDSDRQLQYVGGGDLANGTGDQLLTEAIKMGSGADENGSGILWLWNPSSTTFIKHFFARFGHHPNSAYMVEQYVGGYVNSTSAVDAAIFRMDSGNTTGTIKLFGIKDS